VTGELSSLKQHQNKGLGPAGAIFTASLADETPAQLPLSLKAIQALQERGNTKFIDIPGYPWISIDIHEYPWISMEINGYPWISWDIHRYP